MTDLTTLTEQLCRARRTLDRAIGEAQALAHSGRTLTDEITDLKNRIDLHDKAAVLLTTIGEQRQNTAQGHIEALVTKGLQTIFADDLSFHLTQAVRAKTPVVDFTVRTTLYDGTTIETPVMDARGGGLAATVGFLLRLVELLLSSDRQDTVLFLDETFAHVSAEYEPRLAEFLRELVDKTGVQIVMVTHSDAFLDGADVRYKFQLHHGITKVRQV